MADRIVLIERVAWVSLNARKGLELVAACRPDMLRAGASGYVIKDAAAVELLHAMRAVLAGHTYLSPEVAGAVYDQVQALAGHPELSEQEREVLRLISEGLKTPEIARQLNLSPNTVHTYRRRIMDKLDRHSVAALTKYAVSTGLTTL